jgi:hypothetical protein
MFTFTTSSCFFNVLHIRTGSYYSTSWKHGLLDGEFAISYGNYNGQCCGNSPKRYSQTNMYFMCSREHSESNPYLEVVEVNKCETIMIIKFNTICALIAPSPSPTDAPTPAPVPPTPSPTKVF